MELCVDYGEIRLGQPPAAFRPPPPGHDRHRPHQHGGEQDDEQGYRAKRADRIVAQGDGGGEPAS